MPSLSWLDKCTIFHHPYLHSLEHGVTAQWSGCWIPNQGVLCSKPLCGTKVDSTFHPSQFNWALGTPMHLLLKSKLSPCSGSVILRQLNSIHKWVHKVFLSLQTWKVTISEFPLIITAIVGHIKLSQNIKTCSFNRSATSAHLLQECQHMWFDILKFSQFLSIFTFWCLKIAARQKRSIFS